MVDVQHTRRSRIVRAIREDYLLEDDLADSLFGESGTAVVTTTPPAIVETVTIPRNYPTYPTHTCRSTVRVATIWADSLPIQSVTERHWRGGVSKNTGESYGRCEACYHQRVVRLTQQAIWEIERGERLYWQLSANVKQSTAKYRKRRERGTAVGYVALPDAKGGALIISNQSDGGELLTADCAEIYKLIYKHADTPEGRRESPTDGWGGEWQGSKGDGRRKKARKEGTAVEDNGVRQYWTRASISSIADKMEAAGVPLSRRGNRLELFVFAPTAEKLLSSMGGWYEKGGAKPLVVENVTHKGHIQNPTMSLMRDIVDSPEVREAGECERLDASLPMGTQKPLTPPLLAPSEPLWLVGICKP
jgi:hypothetical protein